MEGADRPVLVFDDDCSFCRVWIEYWQSLTGDTVDYRPYQEALADFNQLSEDQCRKSVQLVTPNGRVYRAAEAVFRSLALAGRTQGLTLYLGLPGFRRLSEALYRCVASHRGLALFLTIKFRFLSKRLRNNQQLKTILQKRV